LLDNAKLIDVITDPDFHFADKLGRRARFTTSETGAWQRLGGEYGRGFSGLVVFFDRSIETVFATANRIVDHGLGGNQPVGIYTRQHLLGVRIQPGVTAFSGVDHRFDSFELSQPAVGVDWVSEHYGDRISGRLGKHIIDTGTCLDGDRCPGIGDRIIHFQKQGC
jgi:hypothetical protein